MEKKNWFNQTISEAEQNLETNLKTGLTSEQVKERQEKYGLNELKEQKKKSSYNCGNSIRNSRSSRRRRYNRYNCNHDCCNSKCSYRSSTRK